VQKIGNLKANEGEKELFIITSITNFLYMHKLILIKKIIIYVSIGVALLGIIISLFLSRNITKPIEKLLVAMHRVKNGRYNTTIDIRSKSEIGELFQGFNDMSNNLNRDKEEMEKYIDEIVMLKEYNEKIIHSIRAGLFQSE